MTVPRPPGIARAARAASRIESIDVVRGAVMALMALDHVRVYSGVPAGGPAAAVFLTRWVTHFCAPAFFFLAGTSAWLRGNGRTGQPSRAGWLATRGLVLVALELTVLRLAWTFNFDYPHYVLAGVVWSLGWCMVLLAGIVQLPLRAIAILGLALIAGHNLIPLLVDGQQSALLATPAGPWLRVLYFGGAFPIGGAAEPNAFVLYSLVPWIGVMSAGYAFGAVMTRGPAARRAACLQLGLAATVAFLVLRGFQWYGDWPWRTPPGEQPWAPAWIRFLATTKYPASLQFLLMTLGPTLIALGALEGVSNGLTRVLACWAACRCSSTCSTSRSSMGSHSWSRRRACRPRCRGCSRTTPCTRPRCRPATHGPCRSSMGSPCSPSRRSTPRAGGTHGSGRSGVGRGPATSSDPATTRCGDRPEPPDLTARVRSRTILTMSPPPRRSPAGPLFQRRFTMSFRFAPNCMCGCRRLQGSQRCRCARAEDLKQTV